MTDDAKYPSQLAERFQIRMPDGLRDRLRDAAAENKRSMNAEIVARLESTFDQIAVWPYLPERYGDNSEEDQAATAFSMLDPKVQRAVIGVIKALQFPSNEPE